MNNNARFLLCDDLIKLLMKFKNILTNFAEEYGLTHVQVHALYILDQQGSVATGKVADALHCDASNVTGIIERLVTSGLVERTEDPQDRRAKKLRLSNEGKNVMKQLSISLPKQLGINGLDDDQVRSVHDSMRQLLACSETA